MAAEGVDLSKQEYVYDFFCEICKESGQNLEAEGYCANCKDYLCITCVTHHKRTRYTLHHNVLDKQSMPKEKPLDFDRCNRIIETRCSEHRRKTVKYFCKKHEIFGCGTCITMKHRNCSDVENVTEIPEDYCQRREFKVFEEQLKDIHKAASDVENWSHDTIRKSETSCDQAMQGIRQWRNEIVTLLDDNETNLVQQVESTKAANMKIMETCSLKVKLISQEVANLSSNIEHIQKSNKICQLYISMKESMSKVRSLKMDVDNVRKQAIVQLSTFKPNKKFLSKGCTPIGSLHLRRTVCTVNASRGRNKVKPRAIKAIPMPYIDMSQELSYYGAGVTSLAMMQRGRMLLCDLCRNAVFLVDTQSQESVYKFIVDDPPFDLCVISDTQAVVTLLNKHTILILSFGFRTIAVSERYSGIAYNNNELFVTCIDPPKLDIIDLQGNVMKTIQYDHDGRRLFECPQYVCVGSDGQTIYVSDCKARKVLQMSCNGDVLSEYMDSELLAPQKICIDGQSNVFVVCQLSCTVHLLTADCTKIKILHIPQDGPRELSINQVMALGHCPESNRLFVGMTDDSRIKVFQIE